MWFIASIKSLRWGCLSLGLCVLIQEGADDLVRSPGPTQDSPAEQSAWLDQTIPKLMAAMRASEEVRAKVAGPPAAMDVPPSPLIPTARGLAPGDLGRWSAITDAAIAANPRYRQGAKASPRPVATVMPQAGIVRVEGTYPAPAAEKDLEPGPLTINAWICPDRETALALFWLRRIAPTIDTRSPEAVRRSVIDAKSMSPFIETRQNPPGEHAFWEYPRSVISVILPKGHKPMPADRLCFLRRNLVVEASTVEFTRRESNERWEAWTLTRCAPDVVAIMRSIDAALLRLADR